MSKINSSVCAKVITCAVAIASFTSVTQFSNVAMANDRYATPPDIILSSNLNTPWLMQMSNKSARQGHRRFAAPGQKVHHNTPNRYRNNNYLQGRLNYQGQRLTYSAQPQQLSTKQRQVLRGMDPRFLPQVVNYQSDHKAGTIIISTDHKYLFLVMENGKARRYGVGVGKQGFTWSGTEKITRKAKWPGWTPPAEMIEREKKKGRILPAHMPGGPENPLGARALYLGSTMYRIHGTTQPWSIGLNISSGCIRMRNEDVTDLYQRVKVGAKVVVL